MSRKMRAAGLFLWTVLAVPSIGVAESSFDATGWRNGADGLLEGLEIVKAEPSALVVYFYTDWCGYCRQFEAELLATERMQEWFANGVAVRINPEAGDVERQVARYYGVQGYPGFFVHNAEAGTFAKVQRMMMENGRPRLKTPEEFIATLEAAASR